MAYQHHHAAVDQLRSLISLSHHIDEQENQLAEGAYQPAQPIQTHAPPPDRQSALVSTSQNAPQDVLYYQGNLAADLTLEDIQTACIEYMESKRLDVPLEDLERSEGLIASDQFREWMTAADSEKLFILGDLYAPSSSSGLSMLCSLIVNKVTGMSDWMPMVFFFILRQSKI